MARLGKFSIGVGDRFTHQAKAQLQACKLAMEAGVEVIPVWNKSNREHNIIGSEPMSVRIAADAAVSQLDWKSPYFCDADHINLNTVDRFISSCDFFTIDVAEYLGKSCGESCVDDFVKLHPELVGTIWLHSADTNIHISLESLRSTADKFLVAIQEAGKVYRHIQSMKQNRSFIAEISMDETDLPLAPQELLIILAAIADNGIPIQTIAPKFSGRFNKGVDYAGDVSRFGNELELDIAVIQHAVSAYSLPDNLKLSIHSGSDKFSIYPVIHAAMKRFGTGVHLKTAGTTWLEEVYGLAEAGGEGLDLAKEIYSEAFAHRAELCAPYQTVIDIDPARLPSTAEINAWTATQFTSALRNNPASSSYNPSLRQLIHVAFKVAAKLGDRFTNLLEVNEQIISNNVRHNLFNRHISPVFLGTPVAF